MEYQVSIPIGFSSSLQLSISGFIRRAHPVSIPIGFSSSLQQNKEYIIDILCKSFNPYRVFKFVATRKSFRSSKVSWQFQSLSGFQVRCNTSRIPFGTSIFNSFNPYRVFKFVATLVRKCIRFFVIEFQSLSGFQVRCNGK